MTELQASGAFEVVPEHARAHYAMIAPLAGVLSIGIVIFTQSWTMTAFVAATAAVIVALLVRSRVIVTGSEVCTVNLIGRKVRPRADIARAVVADLALPMRVRARYVIVLDHDGRPVITLHDHLWKESEMMRVVERLGIIPDDPGGLLSGPQFDRMYPSALPWQYRHPVIFLFLLTSGIMGVLAAGTYFVG